MQIVEIRLERTSLEEDFDIVAQYFDTDILFTAQTICRLEKVINDITELKDRFSVYAVVEAKRYYYYNGECAIVPRLSVRLIQILDYSKEKIMDYIKVIEN